MNAIEFFYTKDDFVINDDRSFWWCIVTYMSGTIHYLKSTNTLEFSYNFYESHKFKTEDDAVVYLDRLDVIFPCFIEEHGYY